MTRTGRLGFVHATLALFAVGVIWKAAQVQLVERERWAKLAQVQQVTGTPLPAPRGEILDVTGKVLAANRAMVRLAVAPREVRNRGRVIASLQRAGVEPKYIDRIRDTTRVWVTIPGYFVSINVADALTDPGVHATPIARRSYALSVQAGGIVGRVDTANEPLDGLELALDALLRGTDGRRRLARDGVRRTFESPAVEAQQPVPGHTVVLTLNFGLQEIAETALARAVGEFGADGGDIVVMNPHTGEILAIASYRSDRPVSTPTALTDPFEPGSTLKPFIAAALLERGLVNDADTVDTGNGELTLHGRTIHDDHPVGRVSLADVIRASSNVGIVQFADRLSPREHYESLRDFGFGTPTGVVFPSEAAGRLSPPSRWSKQSAASLSMGYELTVTPLQLAAAYATFANGGELLEPALIKEIRDPDGAIVYRHERRVVRRVLEPEVAERMRRMLVSVVDSGTAMRADLTSYLLAGKTGTPRATVAGKYERGHYTPNFVGLFPGDLPQHVIVVRISNPGKTIYASGTAAPLTKTVIEAAIAARDAAIDRGKLAESARAATAHRAARAPAAGRVVDEPSIRLAGGSESVGSLEPAATVYPAEAAVPAPLVVSLPYDPSPDVVISEPSAVEVPDVRGLSLREAVRSLHYAGFSVRLVRASVVSTTPVAGELRMPGTLVQLSHPY